MLPEYYFNRLRELVDKYDAAAMNGEPRDAIYNSVIEIISAHMPNILREIELARNVAQPKDYAYLGKIVATIRSYAEQNRDKYKVVNPPVTELMKGIIDYIDSELERNMK